MTATDHREKKETNQRFQQQWVVKAAVKAGAVGKAVIKVVGVVKAECYIATKASTQSFTFG